MMSPVVLLLSAALLLVIAAGGLLWGQRTQRKRGRAAGAFVDQRLQANTAGAGGALAGGSSSGYGSGSGGTQKNGRENTREAAANAGNSRTLAGKTNGKANVRRSLRQQFNERPLESLPGIENIFVRAGIVSHSKWLVTHFGVGVLLTLLVFLFTALIPALLVVLLSVLISWFEVWLRVSKRNKRMVRQLPGFLDALVRQVTVGTSLGSAFQQVAPQMPQPLGEVLNRAAQLNRAGIDLDVAVKQTARIYDLTQLLMIGAVLGVSTRFGGRSDQVLERIAGFMRDLEQAHDELVAMSSETRMSAWVLGALPLMVAGFLVVFNNRFFMQMWEDPLGSKMLLGAVGLQVVGSFMLYRLAKSI